MFIPRAFDLHLSPIFTALGGTDPKYHLRTLYAGLLPDELDLLLM
jgi:hypothetical protein